MLSFALICQKEYILETFENAGDYLEKPTSVLRSVKLACEADSWPIAFDKHLIPKNETNKTATSFNNWKNAWVGTSNVIKLITKKFQKELSSQNKQ